LPALQKDGEGNVHPRLWEKRRNTCTDEVQPPTYKKRGKERASCLLPFLEEKEKVLINLAFKGTRKGKADGNFACREEKDREEISKQKKF